MRDALALSSGKRQVPPMYSVKEIFYTLQGEGAQAGRSAVFCRFAGCNLWTGREADRATAICNFCDTDFVGTDGDGGGKFADAGTLARACRNAWRGNSGTPPFVVPPLSQNTCAPETRNTHRGLSAWMPAPVSRWHEKSSAATLSAPCGSSMN